MRFIADAVGLRLISFNGGDKDNAIPRDASAEFAIDGDFPFAEYEKATELVRRALISDDSEFKAELMEIPMPSSAYGVDVTRRLLDFLSQLRSGPITMSPEVPGMVETSSNLAVVKTVDDGISVTVSSRSSVDAALDDVLGRLNGAARLAACEVSHRDRYPGWAFDPESEILKVYKTAYGKLFGKEPEAVGIHAGLECGLVKSVIPDMDVISIGPEIVDLHSPSERLSISSLDRLYDIVCEMLSLL